MSHNTVQVPIAAWGDETTCELVFPGDWTITNCVMAGHDAREMSDAEIRRALSEPLDTPPLSEMASGRESVVILFDDLVRPTPVARIAPLVLEELRRGGIRDDQIRFVAALGTHQAMLREDFARKLGDDIVERYPVYNHNIYDNLVHLGETSFGTPLLINREVAACDLKVGIGGVVSYFGKDVFNGGGKIILPGVCGIETIHDFHVAAHQRAQARPPDPRADGIPLYRVNIEEAARIAGLDMKVDVVINNHRQPVAVFAGDFVQTHRRASDKAREIYATTVAPPADVVVLNSYPHENQPTRGLWVAAQSVKPGGDLVILSHSTDGLSHPHYLFGRFGTEFGGPAWEPRRHFRVGEASKVIFCTPYLTKLDKDNFDGDRVFFVKTWDQALAMLDPERASPATVAVYPYGGMQTEEGQG